MAGTTSRPVRCTGSMYYYIYYNVFISNNILFHLAEHDLSGLFFKTHMFRASSLSQIRLSKRKRFFLESFLENYNLEIYNYRNISSSASDKGAHIEIGIVSRKATSYRNNCSQVEAFLIQTHKTSISVLK